VEQRLRAGGLQQLVSGAFVGRDVVAAHADTALQPVLRRVEPAQRVDAAQQFVDDDAAHQLLHLAAAPAVEPGEVGHATGGAHAAEEAVALDQQGARAAACGGCRGGDSGRAAAEHDDVEFAVERGPARRLVDPVVHAITAA